MPVTTGNPDEVVMGAGVLYAAPIGTADPTTSTAAAFAAEVTGSSAWREIGWTDAGSTVENNVTISPVKVEEEFYAVKYPVTDIEAFVGFAMKQANRQNLALAMNAGANAANDDTPFEPPQPGDEVRVKLALVTDDGAAWLFRRCINGESIKIDRKKAPNAALLPVKFGLEKPTGSQPWVCVPNADGVI